MEAVALNVQKLQEIFYTQSFKGYSFCGQTDRRISDYGGIDTLKYVFLTTPRHHNNLEFTILIHQLQLKETSPSGCSNLSKNAHRELTM